MALALAALGASARVTDAQPREAWPSYRHAAALAHADSLMRGGLPRARAYLDSLTGAARATGDSDLVMLASVKAAGLRVYFEVTSEEPQREARHWLPRIRARRDTLTWCLALRTIGYSAIVRQRFPEAGRTFGEMLALARRARLRPMEGFALIGTSYIAIQDGHLDRAERGYRTALRLLIDAREARAARTARAGLANALFQQARPTESRREYERVLAESRGAGDLRNAADALNDLGALEFQYGDPSRAAPYYREALTSQLALGRDLLALQSQRNLGLCVVAQGHWVEAAAILDSVVGAAERTRAVDLEVRALDDLAGVRRSQGRLVEAEATLWRVVALRDSCSAEAWADAMSDLARVGILRGRAGEALGIAQGALDSMRVDAPTAARAELQHALGLARLATGDAAGAVRALRASAAARRGWRGQVGAGLIAVEGDLARSFLASARRDSALTHLRLAAEAWEQSRADPDDLEWRETYENDAPRIYGLYAAVLLDPARGGTTASRAAETFMVLQRFRSRTLEDALLGAEAPVVLPRASLEQLQHRALRPGEVFLDVFAAPETTFLFVIDRSHVRVAGAPGSTVLGARLRRFRDLLAAGDTHPAAIAEGATSLGSALLGPVADLVRPARTVLVSAGGFGAFPLGMLSLPGESSPIAVLRRFALVPSGTLFAAERAARDAPAPAGLTVLSRATDVHGRKLDGVAAESRWLARQFPAARVRENDGSTSLEQMMDGLGPRDVLHIASHTRGPAAAPWRAGFLLGSGAGEDAYLTAARIARLPRTARVCVLAGCTSAGGSTSSEGLPNLASAWLASGARAVVATLWQVEDRPTAALMQDLYEGLARGETAGDALVAAQRAARSRSPGSTRPDWGAFTLFGDPDTRVTLAARR